MGASLLQVVNDIFNNAAAMVPIVLALSIYGTSVLKSKLEEYAISIKQNQLEKERNTQAVNMLRKAENFGMIHTSCSCISSYVYKI